MVKKVKLGLSFALLAGLLVVLSLNAPVLAASGETAAEPPVDLGLLVLIDRLELSPTQMRTVHDVLVGILEEGKAVQAERDAFAQELIRFNGSEEELDSLLAAFEGRIAEKAASLHEKIEKGLDELKGTLTIRQGEVLREALGRAKGPVEEFFGIGLRAGRDRVEGMTRGMQGSNQGVAVGNPLRERLQKFLAKHPDLEGELLNALRGPAAAGRAQPSGGRGRQPGNQVSQFLAGRPLVRAEFGERLLARLGEVVKILELKLQYVE